MHGDTGLEDTQDDAAGIELLSAEVAASLDNFLVHRPRSHNGYVRSARDGPLPWPVAEPAGECQCFFEVPERFGVTVIAKAAVGEEEDVVASSA